MRFNSINADEAAASGASRRSTSRNCCQISKSPDGIFRRASVIAATSSTVSRRADEMDNRNSRGTLGGSPRRRAA